MRSDDFHFHAEQLRLGDGAAVLDLLVGMHHEPDGAGSMEADWLSRLALELREQVGGFLLQLRQYRAIGVMHEMASSMPGCAGGELVLLDQNDVGPAQLGEVISKAAARHAAADDQHTRMRLHVFIDLVSRCRTIGRVTHWVNLHSGSVEDRARAVGCSRQLLTHGVEAASLPGK